MNSDRHLSGEALGNEANNESNVQNESITMADILEGEIAKLKEQQRRLFSVVEKLHRGHTDYVLDIEESSSENWIEPEKLCSNCSRFESEPSSPVSLSRTPSSLSVLNMSQSSSEGCSEGESQPTEETASVVDCSAREIISSMWDDFSVDSYRNALDAECNCRHLKSQIKVKQKEWKPHITIPVPFSMTIRDADKEKTRSRALQLAEEERRIREQEEEEECGRQFKASPMPVSAYLPLYDIIVAKNEYRRRKVKEDCKELLKSQERPFKFIEREKRKEKKKKEAHLLNEWEEGKDKHLFRANPVPSHLFDTSVEDKVKEEEEYRKIRIKMRAEKLLRQSKLPGTMKERMKSATEPSTMSAKRVKLLNQTASFHPEVNRGVPNFSGSHAILQWELGERKLGKCSTEVKPFLLRTEMIPSRKERVHEDIMLDEATLPETRWPYVTPRRKMYSVHQRPRSAPLSAPQKTHATVLRETVTKEKLDAVLALEESEEEKRTRKGMRERELKKELSEKMKDYGEEKKRQEMLREKKRKAIQ